MMLLIQIAWRNVWRQKIRSLVVIIAVALGLFAGVFASAFVEGMMRQKIDSVIRLEMSHFQVHRPGFRDDMRANLFIEDVSALRQALKDEQAVEGVSERLLVMSMLGSANATGGITLMGVDPDAEATVTDLHTKVEEGEYLPANKRLPILISQEMAEKYKAHLRSKLVLTLQDVNGDMTAGAFRVVGIYNSGNNLFDEQHAFVRKEDLRQLIGIPVGVHEVAVLLNSHELAEPMATQFQQIFPNLEVLSWMDLASGMRYLVEAFGAYLYIIVGIILTALLFSIVNTMLMAVLERVRELGMLMAIGMNKFRVFGMIMLETIFLAMIGGPLGLLLSWAAVAYFGKYGINLSGAAYGEMGFATIIYPYLDASSYWNVTVMVIVMAVVAAIFPAKKALSLKPAEAIRKI